jgi:hypothetical protein
MEAGGVFPQKSPALMADCSDAAEVDSEAAAIRPLVMTIRIIMKAMDDRVRTGGE